MQTHFLYHFGLLAVFSRCGIGTFLKTRVGSEDRSTVDPADPPVLHAAAANAELAANIHRSGLQIRPSAQLTGPVWCLPAGLTPR